jgi:hypothetical protein
MQTLIKKINSTLSLLKTVENPDNSNITVFHYVTLENENTIGFKFVGENVHVGDYGHFEHESDSDENKDLVHLMVFKKTPESFDVNSLLEIILKHNDLTRNSRDTIKKSFNLKENGFEIEVSKNGKDISLFRDSKKELIGIIQGKEAQKIIDNNKQFTLYCEDRFSENTGLEAAIHDIIENEL